MKPKSQSQRKFFRRIRWYAIIGGVILLVLLLALLVVRSPFFKINEMIVVGVPSELQTKIIAELTINILRIPRSAILGPDNYFSWPEKFPYTADEATMISIKKDLFDRKITLTVTPRQRYAVWCQGQPEESLNCFWIDQLGVIFESAPIADGQLVRTIYSASPIGRPLTGTPILAQEIFSVIKKTLDGLSSLDIGLEKIEYKQSLQELHLITSGGTLLMISTRFDPSPTVLPSIRRLSSNPGLDKLTYINLTVENRAYVKYRQ